MSRAEHGQSERDHVRGDRRGCLIKGDAVGRGKLRQDHRERLTEEGPHEAAGMDGGSAKIDLGGCHVNHAYNLAPSLAVGTHVH